MTSAKLRVPRAFCTEDGDVWWAPGHVDPTAMLLAVTLEQMTLVGAQEAANLITDPSRFDGIDDDRKPIYRQATVEEQLAHADILLDAVQHRWLKPHPTIEERMDPCEPDDPEAEAWTGLFL